MISVHEAKSIIESNIKLIAPARLPLQDAVGLTLAGDILAEFDVPAYPQSSMDGYAFSFAGWQQHKTLRIEGEVAAGEGKIIPISPDQAVRIFTGAAVPPGADTVVMQEKVSSENGALIIDDEKLQLGANVRPKGSEIRSGALALEKGRSLSPAAIGFLAGIGVKEVSVYPGPRITILVTGNELQQPGKRPQHGQVYESNSFTLKAALSRMHIHHVKVLWVKDDPVLLEDTLGPALAESDAVLLTGGISVGEYDFVLQAATRCAVTKMFHKVKQRPGKPLYFGMKGNKPVFGLPGNPSSVFTCYCEYVIPALEKMCGRKNSLKTLQVPIGNSFQKNTGLTHFLKGFFDGRVAFPLEAQESYRMSSFARANCLIQIEEERTEYKEAEMVEIHLLPV